MIKRNYFVYITKYKTDVCTRWVNPTSQQYKEALQLARYQSPDAASMQGLEQLSIDKLRELILEAAPETRVTGRGITKKVLIKKAATLCVDKTAQLQNYKLQQVQKQKYIIWCTELARYCRTYYRHLNDIDILNMKKHLDSLYADYCKEIASPLDLVMFLHELTANPDPFSDGDKLQHLVRNLQQNPKKDIKRKVLSSEVIEILASSYGSLVRVEEIVGALLYNAVMKFDSNRYHQCLKRLKLLSSDMGTTISPQLIMKDLYSLYEETHNNQTGLSYSTFLTQLASKLDLTDNHDVASKQLSLIDLEEVLFNLPDKIQVASSSQLVGLYGNYAYDKNFLGSSAIRTSTDIESVSPREQRPYVVLIQKEIAEIVGIFANWEVAYHHLTAQWPNLKKDLKKNQQQYRLEDGQLLVITKTTYYI